MKALLFLIGVLVGFNAYGGGMPRLAVKNNCDTCHAIDKRVRGPSFAEVANHYRGNKEAPLILYNKIQTGGTGVWGQKAMPPQNVTTREARMLANYILGLPAMGSPVARSQRDPGQRINVVLAE